MILTMNDYIIILSVMLISSLLCCIRHIENNADSDDNSVTELLV